MADDTIKSFLIQLGFKLDESSWSRFQTTIETATLKARLFGDILESVAKAVAGAVARVASDFEDLFYASSRLGASVESIRAFGYAVSQMGGTVAGAQSSLRAFGDWMRQTPGAESFLKSFGVATRDAQGHAIDRGQILLSIGEKLADMAKKGPTGQALATQYAGIFGIDQDTLLAIERKGTRGRYNEAVASDKSAGIGESMARMATAFQQAFRETFMRIGAFLEGAEGKLLGNLKGPLEKFNTWLDAHKDQINDALGRIAESAGKLGEKILNGVQAIDWDKLPGKIDDFAKSISGLSDKFGGFLDNLDRTRKVIEAILSALVMARIGALVGGPVGAGIGAGLGLIAPSIMDAEGDPNAPHSADTGAWFSRQWGRVKRFFGGGGGPEGNNAGRGEYTVNKAYDLIKKVGGTDEEAKTLAAIAQPESAGNPRAHNYNPGTGDDSYGLWQINMLGGMGPERRAKYGLRSNEDLYDPETNAKIALRMHRAANGYGDWSTYKDGSYRAYLGGHATSPAIGSGPANGGLGASAPLGSGGVGYNALGLGGKNVSSNTITNTIHVNTPDPHTAAAAVGLHLDRSSADVFRNLQGAVA